MQTVRVSKVKNGPNFNLLPFTSFDFLEKCLLKLIKLKSLIIEIFDASDLWNSNHWEQYLRKTSINKFDFRFKRCKLVDSPQNILDQFRSKFWLEERRLYVAYKKTGRTTAEIYSLHYFVNKGASNNCGDYPPLLTVPTNLYKNIYDDYPLEIYNYFNKTNYKLSNIPFTNVKCLALNSNENDNINQQKYIDSVASCVSLSKIQIFSIGSFDCLQTEIIESILTHTNQLKEVMMKEYFTKLILPEHTHSLTLYSMFYIYFVLVMYGSKFSPITSPLSVKF
ncbi:hypothetical protein I4U23_027245 [Adineta vaga]|nr:hypothetical protein I4U23_027245 [Adineta vaga]